MAEEGQVISVHTVDEWRRHMDAGNQSKKLIVVDFTASWCGPCRIIAPILADVAKRFSQARFLKVDVDELRTIAEEWAIEAMPTIIFIREGTILDKVVGANKDLLLATVDKHANVVATA